MDTGLAMATVGDLVADAVDDGRVADVQRCGHGRLAGFRDQRAGLRQVADVADDDGSPLPGKAHGDRLPDAAGGSRYHRDSSRVGLVSGGGRHLIALRSAADPGRRA
jgi:hypothetical protein